MSTAAALKAVSTLLDLTMAASHLISKMQEVSVMLAKTHAEGREISAEEWAEMFSADDEADLLFYAAIARKREAEKG